MDKSDQQLEQLFSSTPMIQPIFKCDANHLMDKLCLRADCKEDVIFCHEKKCEKSFIKHKYCPHVDLSTLTNLLSAKKEIQKELLLNIFIIQNKLVEQFNAKRQEIIKKTTSFNFQERDQKIIEQIYFKKMFKGIKPKQTLEVYKNLMNAEMESNQNVKESIEDYQREAKQIMNKMSELRQKILQKCSHSKQVIQSRIIVRTDSEFTEHLKFIRESFGKPVNFQLLFRASENQFSAQKFHQKCDGIEHTFGIVRTQFGKTIAGYTPLKWKGTGKYMNDKQWGSFLLSFDLKQKMALTRPQYAIYCSEADGIVFGGGHDIYISDKCNQNQYSYSNIPHSYSYLPKPNFAKSYTAFSGATNNYNFRVTQWEVFRVIYK